MRNRWYDSSTQRFISRDPIGLAAGANLYAYVSNNPTTRIDPLGLSEWPPGTGPDPASADAIEQLRQMAIAAGMRAAKVGEMSKEALLSYLKNLQSSGPYSGMPSRFGRGATTSEAIVIPVLGGAVFILTYGNVANCLCQYAIDRYIKLIQRTGNTSKDSWEYAEMIKYCDTPMVWKDARDYAKDF